MRLCSSCKELRPNTAFLVRYNRKRGKLYPTACDVCRRQARKRYRASNPRVIKSVERASKLKQRYGLTPEGYKHLLCSQDSKCAICRSANPGGTKRNFHVDHCHVTKRVRGLLCDKCNRGLGFFNDDVNVLARAVDYMMRDYYGDHASDVH